MDYKAFLQSGRKVFYYNQYRTEQTCWSGMGVSWATGHLSWGVHPGRATSSPALLHPREVASVAAATYKTHPPARRA